MNWILTNPYSASQSNSESNGLSLMANIIAAEDTCTKLIQINNFLFINLLYGDQEGEPAPSVILIRL